MIIARKISIAPMMDWTDRHCRYLFRLLTKHSLLYTEMVHTGAIFKGDRERFLAYHPAEHPLALQLGGNNPEDLATCAQIAQDYAYDEVNLNVGCPSGKVQKGQFGVCLMKTPHVVAECIARMQAKVTIPVTVKTRIGVDEFDDYDFLYQFVDTVAQAGCDVFIIHARKAWLKGLNPKQNREVPPLNYDRVAQLKKDFPLLTFIINGGISTCEQASELLQTFDGVMLGRAVYQQPARLLALEQTFYHGTMSINWDDILEQFQHYAANEMKKGVPLHAMTRHLLGLFQGQYGAKAWRRCLSENARKACANETLIRQAANLVLAQ